MADYELVPEGRYPARCIAEVMAKTGTGKEQLAAQFEISEGEYAGRTQTWRAYFTDAALEKTLEQMETCGWDARGLSQESLDTMQNNPVVITVKHKPDDKGVLRDGVAWVNSMRQGPIVKEVLEESAVKNLEKALMGSILDRRQKQAKKPQPAPTPYEPPKRAPAAPKKPPADESEFDVVDYTGIGNNDPF